MFATTVSLYVCHCIHLCECMCAGMGQMYVVVHVRIKHQHTFTFRCACVCFCLYGVGLHSVWHLPSSPGQTSSWQTEIAHSSSHFITGPTEFKGAVKDQAEEPPHSFNTSTLLHHWCRVAKLGQLALEKSGCVSEVPQIV